MIGILFLEIKQINEKISNKLYSLKTIKYSFSIFRIFLITHFFTFFFKTKKEKKFFSMNEYKWFPSLNNNFQNPRISLTKMVEKCP